LGPPCICVAYGLQWDICFNPVKSQIACFGGKSPDREFIYIGSMTVDWSERVKYLSCYFRCNKDVDPSRFIGKFYGTFNNILNVLGSKKDEILTIHLMKTYCLPSLLYGCEIWNLNNTEARSIELAWNNAFRKVFNCYWRESVKPLQFYCQCLPASMLMAMRKTLFWRKMFYHNNIVLHILAKECYQSVMAVTDSYIKAYQVVNLNNFGLRNLFWLQLSSLPVNRFSQ